MPVAKSPAKAKSRITPKKTTLSKSSPIKTKSSASKKTKKKKTPAKPAVTDVGHLNMPTESVKSVLSSRDSTFRDNGEIAMFNNGDATTRVGNSAGLDKLVKSLEQENARLRNENMHLLYQHKQATDASAHAYDELVSVKEDHEHVVQMNHELQVEMEAMKAALEELGEELLQVKSTQKAQDENHEMDAVVHKTKQMLESARVTSRDSKEHKKNLLSRTFQNRDKMLNATLQPVQEDVKKKTEFSELEIKIGEQMIAAAEGGMLSEIQRLGHMDGIDIEYRGSGKTALYAAACKDQIEAVKALCETFHANVNNPGRFQMTPVCIAAKHGNTELVRLLAGTYHANIFLGTSHNQQPLHMAAERGHVRVVQLLLNLYKAKVNATTNRGDTPLILASKQGHMDVVRALINESNADVNKHNMYGTAPIHVACKAGYLDVVEFLCQAGADIDDTDLRGISAISVAMSKGHDHIVVYLAKLGADLDQIPLNDRRALLANSGRADLRPDNWLRAE